jgi:hypothetical protein
VATDADQTGLETPANRRRRSNLTVLHRRARSALAEALLPGEVPCLVIPGLDHTAMIATDRRVLVFKRGARAGLPFGSRLKAFEYESVLRVDVGRSGDLDLVVIHAPLKIASCASYWVNDRDDPWRARNAIPVGGSSAEIEDAVAELSRLVATVRDRPKRVAERKNVAREIADIERSGSRVGLKPVPAEGSSDRPAGPTYEACPRCGKTLRVGWQFCRRCGAPARVAPARRPAARRPRRS